jgi:hypothetical protein
MLEHRLSDFQSVRPAGLEPAEKTQRTECPLGTQATGLCSNERTGAASDRGYKTALTLQPLILFAFVLFRRNNAVLDGVGVHRDTNPVKHRQAETEAGAGDGSQPRESQHNQGADGE